MKTFAFLLIVYALGGFWYATYDTKGCTPGFDWTLPCLPGEFPMAFWALSIMSIALFVIFVFPGFSAEQSRDTSLVRYLLIFMAGFVVYKLTSMTALLVAHGGF